MTGQVSLSLSLSHTHTHTHTHTNRQAKLYSDSQNPKVFRQLREIKIFRTEWYQEFPAFNRIFIPSRIKFWFGGVFEKKKVYVNWVCSEMGHTCRHLSRFSTAIILKCWHYTNTWFCKNDNLQSPCVLWCTSTLPLDRGPSNCPVDAYHSGRRTLTDWRKISAVQVIQSEPYCTTLLFPFCLYFPSYIPFFLSSFLLRLFSLIF